MEDKANISDKLKAKLDEVQSRIESSLNSTHDLLGYRPAQEDDTDENFARAFVIFAMIKMELQNIMDYISQEELNYISIESEKSKNIIKFPEWRKYNNNKK